MLDRGDYWQCAYRHPQGRLRRAATRAGLGAFRDDIVELAPFLADRVGELSDWDDVKLLTVAVDRLQRWYRPGLLCIGDAAHAMSPVGGVGINLAIQDAVAAANILAVPLRKGPVPVELLAQGAAAPGMADAHDAGGAGLRPEARHQQCARLQTQPRAPFAVKLLNRFPLLRRIPARLIGMGFRPEHVQSPELKQRLGSVRLTNPATPSSPTRKGGIGAPA